jgi:hypothetical protein
VKRKSALTLEDQRFGLEPPKGILITGEPDRNITAALNLKLLGRLFSLSLA